ncbi:Thiosulfate sulfurtransferase GlpE [Aquicella siphonis]|uniref:Thiosulfate sulfurtransferase GlpE n=1 Tax=Aquicella siphonis TaxID=254247 RepID=A0A5E4PDS6_9COXI|nr:rhodanese-like domain-containing protein [Aquicella siphonis]VVC75109.1 Thiosulfate sulfurtransferase GlpE [Aquicella siphonis]
MQDLTTFIAQHPLLSLAAAIVLILLILLELMRAKRNVFNISPSQVTHLINRENAAVIDVRQQDAFRAGHIIDAVSMPPQDILQNPKKLEKFRARPLVIVANSSSESQKIAALLLKQGYNAYSLTGGIRAWNEAQMPLIKE